MPTERARSVLDECRVVVGVDAVLSLRAAEPMVPIVALVDDAASDDAVLVRAAGADVVLAAHPLGEGGGSDGLGLAARAARAIARRRAVSSRSSRRAQHDVAQALNVIALAAEAGVSGRLDPAAALAQIQDLAADAGADAWRAGHAHRASQRTLARIDLRALLDNAPFGPDVEVWVPDAETLVIADEVQLLDAVGELVDNARRAGATEVGVRVTTTEGSRVSIVVSDDGSGFTELQAKAVGEPFCPTSSPDRLGLGLASVVECAEELGGSVEVLDRGQDGRDTRVALTVPTVGVPATTASPMSVVDQATAQANILEGVVRHAPLSESLEAIVAAIEHQLSDTICSVLLLEDGTSLHHGAGARLPAAYRKAIDGVTIGLRRGSCGTAAHLGEPVVASDVTVDHNWVDFRDVAMAHGLRSCWSTPIVAAEGGEVLGTFAVYRSTPRGPQQAEIRLVNRFTYLAAVAIEHHRLFGALAESEARFRSAFEGAAAGIALVALDGSLLQVNPALAQLVGRSAPDLVGSSVFDLVEASRRSTVIDSWAELMTPGNLDPAHSAIEVPLRNVSGDDGPELWISLHASSIMGKDGREPYLYLEVHDVTAARQQLADLRAREAAEAANRAKTHFMTLVSHELRTPLNAILGFAQVLQLIDLDEHDRTHSVDQIVLAGRHLRDLIGQLLDLSRIEAGQLAVVAEQVAVDDVIDEAVELVRPLAAARRIQVLVGSTPVSASTVVADRRCVRQVLINLLDNAVKYTPVGGRIDVVVSGTDDGAVRISVTDTGPGIATESQRDVFEPFHRLDRGSGDEHEGTGLGLALCARLMEEMGGSVGLSSAVGAGSCFWMEFPSASTSTTRAPAVVFEQVDVGRDGPGVVHPGTVLYIEDDPASVEVIRGALRLRPEVRFRAASTAEEGLAVMANETVDLVMLDIGLPDRSGWDLLVDLRRDDPDLPVVVVTAGTDVLPDAVPDPDLVLAKPLDLHEALAAVDMALAGATHGGVAAEARHAVDE